MSNPPETIAETAPVEQVRFIVLLPLCIAAFSGLLNVAVLAPFVALIAADLNVGVPWIGYTATAALASTAIFGLVVGWLADVAGFRRILIAGLGLLALSGIGAALSLHYAFFLLARVVGAIGFSAASGLPNAIAAHPIRRAGAAAIPGMDLCCLRAGGPSRTPDPHVRG